MSVSGISSGSTYQPLSSTSNDGSSRRDALKSLVDGINSGDLTSAKAAFETLGLSGALSSQRSNGLAAMTARIRHQAEAAQPA